MTSSILSQKRILLFFILWWGIWTVLVYLILHEVGIDDLHAFLESITSTIVLSVITFFIANNLRYYLPKQDKWLYVMVMSASASLLWLILLQVLLKIILSKGDLYLVFFKNTWTIRFSAGFLLTSSINMFSLLWYSQQEQKQVDERKAEMEQLAREAELLQLRQQLQPHFLFNSLNSISALITVKPEKARSMIEQLSDFLRSTLRKDEHQLTTLRAELDQLHLYLEIEKVRFGYRLQTEVNFKEELLEAHLPVLILQPLVENAIKFGLYDTTDDILIKINVSAEGENLKIEVRNPFDADTYESMKGTGFGLSSVHKRLFLLYGRPDLLKTRTESNIFVSTIYIPVVYDGKSDYH